jgi:hypothetical protein
MATSKNIPAMSLLPTTATYVPKWMAALHDSVNVPTSSSGSSITRGSMSTNFGESQWVYSVIVPPLKCISVTPKLLALSIQSSSFIPFTTPSDRVLYRLGKRAERLINHWKRFRHWATRDAQQADNYRSLWLVAVILL